MFTKPLGHVLGFAPHGRSTRHGKHFTAGLCGRTLPANGGRLPSPVPRAEQRFDPAQQTVAVVASGAVQQRRKILHVPDQVRPAQLQPGVALSQKLAIGREVVTADDPAKRLAQISLQHLRAPRRVDVEPREAVLTGHMEAPTPQPAATLAVPRLVNSHRRLLRQSLLQLLVAGRHRRTGFLHRLEHLAVADWQLKHIGQKSANRLDRHVTSALLISHQRRQPRTKQPRPPHFLRQRRGQHLARAKVLIQSGAMLAHDIGFLNQLDLLDDAKAVERFPTCRHGLPLVVPSLVHLLRRKSWSGMTGVSQLTASPSLPAFSAACRRTRRLDDVAAGRLGGGCGVLLQTCAFALQIRDSCQRSVQLFLQLGDHGLQPFTARTMFSVCPHASIA